jgi:hypothetical protein
MIQRNGSQGDSTNDRMMRMYAIDCIDIHSVDDDDVSDEGIFVHMTSFGCLANRL